MLIAFEWNIIVINVAPHKCRLQRNAPHHFEIERNFVSKDVGTKITLCIQHLVESLRTSMFHFRICPEYMGETLCEAITRHWQAPP